MASQILEKIENISSFLLIGIPSRGVYLYKLLAKYLEELSGQQIENGCLDLTFHIDDLAMVGTRVAKVTESSCWVDYREVVLIEDVIFTGKTIKASLEALHSCGWERRLCFFLW